MWLASCVLPFWWYGRADYRHYMRAVLIGINAQKLFVTRDYRNAGVSRYIERLVRHLPGADGGVRYRLYTNHGLRRWPGVEGPCLEVVPTPVPTTHPVLRILWEQTVLPLIARRDGVDLLHCPLNVRPLAGRLPAVVTIHDLSFLRFPDRFDPLKQRYHATLTRYSARTARRILADSQSTKRDVVTAFDVPPSRVDVVYPGVDDDFRPYAAGGTDGATMADFRRRHGLPERMILYLGTLEPRKNVDKLVEAFAGVVRRGLPHILVLAGGKGWQYEAIFAAVARHELEGRVRFPGYVDRAEQPHWYNAADVFVYPSQYEGFGLPALEAMACGVPVITSNTSSLPEVVGSAGATVDPTDVEALTETMVAILTDDDRAAAMGRAGRERAAGFTWPAAAAACVAAYRQASRQVAA
jgi:glycosyltransferase involved in cell wall biosynthesis